MNEFGELVKENIDEYNCNSFCDLVIFFCKLFVIIVNDDFFDFLLWVKLENCNFDDFEFKLIFYYVSKSSIFNKISWLIDLEIYVG